MIASCSTAIDAPNVFIMPLRKPLVEIKPMIFGSMPNDGGNLILSTEEKNELLKNFPDASKFIKKFIGSREFINKIDRWCLWIKPIDLKDAAKIKPIRERIENVKLHRESSTRKSTQELALYPYAFGEIRHPDKHYLLVPRVSSENRKYIPIGYVDSDTIASDAVLIVPEAHIAHFSLLCSNVHMSWIRVVAGRLKSDYRYSASIVYNNFPWLNLNDESLKKLEVTGNLILKARNLYKEWSFAELYSDLTMPPELRKAHQENDKAVMEAYGFDWRNMTESTCVAELMKLYQNLITN